MLQNDEIAIIITKEVLKQGKNLKMQFTVVLRGGHFIYLGMKMSQHIFVTHAYFHAEDNYSIKGNILGKMSIFVTLLIFSTVIKRRCKSITIGMLTKVKLQSAH